MTTADTQQITLTRDLVMQAYDELEAYDEETMSGGEPLYPQWAADLIARAHREGFFVPETQAEAA